MPQNNQPTLPGYAKSENRFLDRTIATRDFGSAWQKLLSQLFFAGLDVAPRGILTKELLGITLRVEEMTRNILVNEIRDLNYRFMVAEWWWIREGRSDLEFLLPFNKNMAKFSDNGYSLAGAYGPRLISQRPWMRKKLMEDAQTREAVATIWTPRPEPSKDIPCTISLQLIQRDGLLHGIVNMRSSDVWLGLPYDFFTFSMLVIEEATHLNLKPGSLQFHLGSSHLYHIDSEKAGQAVFVESHSLQVSDKFDPKDYAKIMQVETKREAFGKLVRIRDA